MDETEEDFGQQRATDRAELLAIAALLRLLEDVLVPERRLGLRMMLPGSQPIRPLRYLFLRQGMVDVHRLGDILPR